MRIKIADGQSTVIRGRTALEGDTANVKKELGERLISEGVANRIIEEPENRVTSTEGVMRFTGHRRRYRGTDGKQYIKHGPDKYVEVKE